MSEDRRFANKVELEDWLKSRGVDEEDVADAADALFAMGYKRPSTMLGITVQELETYAGITGPVARHLSNKLEKRSVQQPNF